jgi:hypothetical protein
MHHRGSALYSIDAARLWGRNVQDDIGACVARPAKRCCPTMTHASLHGKDIAISRHSARRGEVGGGRTNPSTMTLARDLS